MGNPFRSTMFVVCLWWVAAESFAAPAVTNVSLRGLQIGGTTTVVVEGSDLLPNPVVIASFPIASQSVRPNAQANRVEFDLTLSEPVIPGIFQIRLGSGKGISNPIRVGLDRLSQQPFMGEIASLPVALHGSLSGTQVVATRFRGTKGQKFVADVEAQRLGANFKPVLRIKDAQGRQIAWSPANPRIAGDARLSLELPDDGDYTVELHDVLYRAASPGFFRLKLGDLKFADLALPMGVQMGSKVTLRFAASNLPSDTTTEFDASGVKLVSDLPAPLTPFPHFTGSPPRVVISGHAELLETSATEGQRQELPVVPVAVSGRLSQQGDEDQFVLPVNPGSRLRFEVYAQRFGSPLDGVLSLRNEKGEQVASSDDRPGMADPGLDFAIPAEMNKLVIALRDLVGRGGDEFVYRVEVTDLGQPDFRILADADRINVPAGATQVIRLQVNRMGYDGPIGLSVDGLPSNAQLAGQEIPAGATVGLLTISAAEGPPLHLLGKILAQQAGQNSGLPRVARTPEDNVTKHLPWLRDELALSITEPSPVRIAWANSNESPMYLGEKFPLTVAIQRGEGVQGNVRLRLLTTQIMPRKKIKENNQDKEVDDLDRALRLEGEPMLAADVNQTTVNVLVPADLSAQDWGLVLAADLLGGDNKAVLATTTTTHLSKRPTVPFSIELASSDSVEAKAGLGDTGKLVGKIHRQPGFAQPVTVTLQGLPKEYAAPPVTVPADKEDFEFPVRFAYGSKPAELKDIKLIGVFQPNPQNAEVVVRSNPVAIGVIKVVPGEPPSPSDLLAIFEDDEKFLGMLSKGGGMISLDTQEKFSGSAAAKVTPDQRFNETVPTLNVKIREKPAPGEYRYLRFAWKKKGGASVCLQINHDGGWGPGGSGKPDAKFRYHAGPGGECYGASVVVDEKLPADFVVVNRDLFADFGEFTFTGIAFSPVDGEYALFDQLYLARSSSDFEQLNKGK